MSYKEQQELLIKAIRWTVKACDSIERVGGSARVLDNFSDEALTAMIRNGLQILPVKG